MARIKIAGADIEVQSEGAGRPLLFLHGEDYFGQHRPFFEALAKRFRVVIPRHPGFGSSSLPDTFRTVDDLAYLYLDLIENMNLERPLLVGASLGGWIALEMAVRAPAAIDKLALLGTVGVKMGAREDRDFADIYQIPETEMRALTFADPGRFVPKYAELSQDELVSIARDRESTWHFAWKPYMHNPTLKTWLHRVRMPTLMVWGEQDGIARVDYARALSRALPDARLEVVPNAGHYPQIEQAAKVAALIEAF
ncbi:MAG: alpha/beta hydrolase [Hyphomicrobiaceae bacterium]|nr:alpha/beta hydrolase [Hyphomicrobiaceae bacterium]